MKILFLLVALITITFSFDIQSGKAGTDSYGILSKGEGTRVFTVPIRFKDQFKRVPTVMTAINAIDSHSLSNLRLNLEARDITR